MDSGKIDRVIRKTDDTPWIGAETEGVVTDMKSLEVVHTIGGIQTSVAVKAAYRERDSEIAEDVESDIPTTTIEANPPPLRSPLATAAVQRLMTIITNKILENKSGGKMCLIHGSTLRPPNVKKNDVAEHVTSWKKAYYAYQIGTHRDKIAAATGDHLNLSAPWLDQNPSRLDRSMIELTGRERLVGGALAIGLTAASPLHYSVDSESGETEYRTALTPWESARLGAVWPGRTIMDQSDMYFDPKTHRRTMRRYAGDGVLLSGRDIWLLFRAKEIVESGQSFEEVIEEEGLSDEEAIELLMACYQYSADKTANPHKKNPKWQAIENWRQDQIEKIIRAKKSRIEIRAFETPPAFNDITPYEYIKSVQTFFSLLFIYLSQNPEELDEMEYDSYNLSTARWNEEEVLKGGMDTSIYWIPKMEYITPRKLLKELLEKMDDLSRALGMHQDLHPLRMVAEGKLGTPAQRIREEVSQKCSTITAKRRDKTQMLPNGCEYPQILLQRTIDRMKDEIAEIEEDLTRMHPEDRIHVNKLLQIYKELERSK